IDESLPLEEAKSIETKIRALDNILSADFKSNEEALEDFAANYEGGMFGGVDASYLRHRVQVFLEDNALMEQTVAEIQKIPGVAQVSAAFELAEFFSTLQRVLQIASLAVIAVLLVVSLLIISNTVKLGMHERRDEISIMKMVGATNGFIRLPFVVEGFTLGMLGATAAFGLEWLLYDWVCVRLEMMTALNLITLVPFNELLVPMVITFLSAGLFVGIVGSWTSIQKFMDV
ncbi:MAG: FtsX-like permease family protein, partial [Ruminococcaceae bacterium]|nr:FtsX-like permease family protein [Oscillospiraceae bacterium]